MNEIISSNDVAATVQPPVAINSALTAIELNKMSPEYFVNVGMEKFARQIFPDEYRADFAMGSVAECLKSLKSKFEKFEKAQRDDLAEIIGKSSCFTDKLVSVTDAITMPSQLILGLMLAKLKKITEHGEFTDLAKKYFPDLSKKTMNNYMNAARILKHADFEKYLTCGLNVLSKLGMLLKKKRIKGDDLFAAIAQAFKVISKNREPDDEDYLRVAEYVTILKIDFVGYPGVDLEKFYELYKSGFSFSTRDLAFIKRKSKENLTYVNEFMSKLLENNLNRRKLVGYIPKKEARDPNKKSKANVEPFSVSLAKIIEVAKSVAENHTKICEEDFKNLQGLKLYIESIEKNYNPD